MNRIVAAVAALSLSVLPIIGTAAPATAYERMRPIGKVVKPYKPKRVVIRWSTWKPVTQELADVLAEGDDTPPMNADTRRWEACQYRTLGERMIVRCPDATFRVM